MKTHFVLVDLENVQPRNMALLVGEPYKIKVFVGPAQQKIPVELAQAMQTFGTDAEYVRIPSIGKNVLDFHIAYYVGRLSAEHPDSAFHIISKDTGFDPLIKHLRAHNVSCDRHIAISGIFPAKTQPRSAATTLPPPSDIVDAVIENLAKRKTGRPKSVKTLLSSIKALVKNSMSEEDDFLDVVEQLRKRGVLTTQSDKITYHLPE